MDTTATPGERIGIALVGIGPGARPHLRSLHDLQDSIALRHAITRRPQLADMGPFQGQLLPSSDLDAALSDPLVQAVIIATPPSSHLDEKEDMLWVTYNESGRMILMKRDLGYFNFDQAQTLLNLFSKKYSVAYEPSPATLNTYKIGLKDTLSFVFANGQIVFQVGRSFNKRNELMNIFIFPPDVGATFLENVKK